MRRQKNMRSYQPPHHTHTQSTHNVYFGRRIIWVVVSSPRPINRSRRQIPSLSTKKSFSYCELSSSGSTFNMLGRSTVRSPNVSWYTPAEVNPLCFGERVWRTATKLPPPAKQVSTTPSDVMSQKTPVIFKIFVWAGGQAPARRPHRRPKNA